MYADPDTFSALMFRRLTILDTRAGPNFIRLDVLSSGYEQKLEPTTLPSINDPDNRPLQVLGQLSAVARLGSCQAKEIFLVCQRLAAPVILGSDFCDNYVDSLHV